MRRMLITGGGRGIGRATALLAAARGWAVAFSYRSDGTAAAETLEALRAHGRPAAAIPADAGEEADMRRLFDEATTTLGGIDAVVVNAGIVAPAMRLADMDLSRIERVLRTNLLGALLAGREAARRLGPGSAVVMVSSVAARLGSAFEYVDYAASKGGVDSLTIGLARELGPQGIRVNAVRPGLIETEIHASGGDPGRARRLGEGVPMGRPGTAEETAEAILWLAGPEAGYVTGAILDVAGGR